MQYQSPIIKIKSIPIQYYKENKVLKSSPYKKYRSEESAMVILLDLVCSNVRVENDTFVKVITSNTKQCDN